MSISRGLEIGVLAALGLSIFVIVIITVCRKHSFGRHYKNTKKSTSFSKVPKFVTDIKKLDSRKVPAFVTGVENLKFNFLKKRPRFFNKEVPNFVRESKNDRNVPSF